MAGNYLRATSPDPTAVENVAAATVLHDLLSGLGLAAGDFTRVTSQDGILGLEGVDLLSGAPAALDTLNELAAALGDDANFAATVAAQLADAGRLTTGTVDRDRLPAVGFTVQRGVGIAGNDVTINAVDTAKTYVVARESGNYAAARPHGATLIDATTVRLTGYTTGSGGAITVSYQVVESD